MKEEKFSKDIRRVFRIGDSLAITLPPEFVKEHGLKGGEKLEVLFDSVLKAKPVRPEEVRKELEEKE